MEKLYIKNFGGIDEAEFEFRPITVLIGPQASGKSVVLKLLYFFRTVPTKLSEELQKKDQDLEDSNQVNERLFIEIFPPVTFETGFYIKYTNNEYCIVVTGKHRSSDISISFDKFFSQSYSDTREAYYNGHEVSSYKGSLWFHKGDTATKKLSKICILPNVNRSQQRVVPADRSLFNFIHENSFAVLGKQEVDVDYFIKEFGITMQFIYSKIRNLNLKIGSLDEEFNRKVESILKARAFLSEQKEVFLKHIKDGRHVPLSHASSGQQQATPLLTLFNILYPDEAPPGTKFYVEEPESNIFPQSQKTVVELFIRFKNRHLDNVELLITTHSPYILSSFNNLLMAGRTRKRFEADGATDKLEQLNSIVPREEQLDPDDFMAYSLENGGAKSIIDPDTGETLPEGKGSGELVVTTLTKEGIPLIRYRTRDITSIDYTPCVCGRTTARIAIDLCHEKAR
ncbi:MAG: AAA family ATPase, partial [Bacteroidota bacterium]